MAIFNEQTQPKKDQIYANFSKLKNIYKIRAISPELGYDPTNLKTKMNNFNALTRQGKIELLGRSEDSEDEES